MAKKSAEMVRPCRQSPRPRPGGPINFNTLFTAMTDKEILDLQQGLKGTAANAGLKQVVGKKAGEILADRDSGQRLERFQPGEVLRSIEGDMVLTGRFDRSTIGNITRAADGKFTMTQQRDMPTAAIHGPAPIVLGPREMTRNELVGVSKAIRREMADLQGRQPDLIAFNREVLKALSIMPE